MDDLALQVRLVHDVRVDDPDATDTGGSEIERRGRAEAARADEQDLRVEQLQLPLLADLRDQQVTAVARALRSVQAGLELHGEAVALPVGESAGERDDVLVAEVGERLRREGRAVARRAVDDQRAARVGCQPLDPGLQMAARDVDGPGDVALVPLVLLPDVDDDGLAGVDPVPGLGRVELRDLGPRLLQELSIRRHRYRKYSFAHVS